jgi:alkanesulfonate monooxygenase SsuD/methylene tetrahydromethanopterin reductase-like flavin-dependent oxidoreductase (luciferase family)
MKLGITMPSRTAPLSRFGDYARMADEAGFESVWTYELYRNPFSILTGAAATTSRAELCTGLATAFTRSPFEAANAAADVDEASDGRMKLGLGTGVPEFLSAFHSTDFKRPIKRLGEYVEVLRRSWAYLARSSP